MGNDLILGLVLTLVVLVFLFFIFRELNNWYWKINERISIAHKTNFLAHSGDADPHSGDVDPPDFPKGPPKVFLF